ncbi:hypothetical protein DSO57_1015967 [Entomophthora muscae]|uniref:Uncharacterized protein n=1 Tax=Entomophthora muscae TaxID=34485 RepID=A0ACC2T4X6_9FUNG|nr:hypothetical protein DSO57_1015967 [Entomophthora muscae]
MGAKSSKALSDIPLGYRLKPASADSKQNDAPVELEELTFGHLPSMTSLAMCSTNLMQLTPHVGQMKQMQTIQMCCNQLVSLPREIGHLNNLTQLDLSKNRLKVLPDTIGLLTKLVELKISNNQLVTLPASIGMLTKLTTLLASHNELGSVPRECEGLVGLTTLDLSHNPIRALPAEIGQLQFLRRLALDGCPLLTEDDLCKLGKQYAEEPRIPLLTLKELAARALVQNQVPVHVEHLPPRLYRFLISANTCSFCHGPFFSHSATRGRMMDKNDTKIPLEYRLCTPHWKDDRERISLLFCAAPDPAPRSRPTLRIVGRPGRSRSQSQSHPETKQNFFAVLNRSSHRTNDPTFLTLDRTPQLPQLPNHPPKVSLQRRSFVRSRRSLSIYVP